MFSAFVTCCIIASERASGSVPRVIRVLRVPVSCLHPCFWMHVLRYPCSVRSFQLQKDRFWAWAEDTPQEEEEEEEEEDDSSSSSSSSTCTACVLRALFRSPPACFWKHSPVFSAFSAFCAFRLACLRTCL